MCKALEELEDIQFVDPIYEIIKQNPTITINNKLYVKTVQKGTANN